MPNGDPELMDNNDIDDFISSLLTHEESHTRSETGELPPMEELLARAYGGVLREMLVQVFGEGRVREYEDSRDQNDFDFAEFRIYTPDGETVMSLYAVTQNKLVQIWRPASRTWEESLTSLPEMDGLGGSADYDRVSPEFAARFQALAPGGRGARIENV